MELARVRRGTPLSSSQGSVGGDVTVVGWGGVGVDCSDKEGVGEWSVPLPPSG